MRGGRASARDQPLETAATRMQMLPPLWRYLLGDFDGDFLHRRAQLFRTLIGVVIRGFRLDGIERVRMHRLRHPLICWAKRMPFIHYIVVMAIQYALGDRLIGGRQVMQDIVQPLFEIRRLPGPPKMMAELIAGEE